MADSAKKWCANRVQSNLWTGAILTVTELRAAFARCFSFAFSFDGGFFVALAAFDLRQNAGFLNFFLEALQSLFDAFTLCNSNFRQGSSPWLKPELNSYSRCPY